jgi:DNA repair protein RadC
MDPAHAPNAKLLSALIGRAVASAEIQRYGRLTGLAQGSFDELREPKSVGPSKAVAIRAALQLTQRLLREGLAEPPQLDSPERVADPPWEEFRTEPVKQLRVLLVNTQRRLIAVHPLSQGTLDNVLVHPRDVLRPAITARAAAVILAHSHAGGDLTQSEADISVARDLIKAGQLVMIEVLEHIMLGQRTTERLTNFVSLWQLGYFL